MPANSQGRVEATLTGLWPWGRLALSEGVDVWGAAGYGTGELTVTPKKPGTDEDGATIRTDLDLRMAAAGLRGVLVDGGPNGLTLHKTANVLNKLPKSQHSKAKRALQEIWMAETRNHADSAFDAFIETYAVKYDKAAACLVKDRETMLAFYDFPAEHWKHLRTTNPIESTFATVRHRTVRSRGCLSNKTALAMVFKLAQAAQNSWRRLDGHNQLPKLIVGVKFIDGIEAVRQKPQAAA